METQITQQDLVKRGQILSQRLELLNDFILDEKETGQTLAEYLKKKGITKEFFFSQIPKSYIIMEIGGATADDEKLIDYTTRMAKLYGEQYGKYMELQEELSAEGDEEDENEYADAEEESDEEESADGEDLSRAVVPIDKTIEEEFYNAKGRGKKRRQERKKERKEKKAPKKAKRKEKRKERKAKRKEKGGIVGKANKFNPLFVAGRNAYLGMVKLNVLNIAYRLNKVVSGTGKGKLLKRWAVLGGKKDALLKAINVGKNKKPIFAKKKSVDGEVEFMDSYFYEAVGTAATLAAAAPIIIALLPILKQFGLGAGEPDLPSDETEDIPKTDLDKETEDALKETDITDDDKDDDDEESFFEKNKMVIYIGGGIAAALVLTLIISATMKK